MTPRIITARKMDLHFQNIFGELGPELYVTGHWTAGVKDKSLTHAINLVRSYHKDHKAKGWGGIGYHYLIMFDGSILCLRPTRLKGAHVGGYNSNNVGIVMCGGAPGHTGKPTIRQRRSLKWLLANAHTTKMPSAHRTERKLANCIIKGHKQWPGHTSNACPGTFLRTYVSRGEYR